MASRKAKVDPSIGRQMEMDILRAIADYGWVGPGSESEEIIMEKYPNEHRSDGNVEMSKANDMLVGLVDDGLVSPYIGSSGTRYRNMASGLTAKGWERLYELEHPNKCWMRRQWFPLVVAAVTAMLAIANIISDLLLGT